MLKQTQNKEEEANALGLQQGGGYLLSLQAPVSVQLQQKGASGGRQFAPIERFNTESGAAYVSEVPFKGKRLDEVRPNDWAALKTAKGKGTDLSKLPHVGNWLCGSREIIHFPLSDSLPSQMPPFCGWGGIPDAGKRLAASVLTARSSVPSSLPSCGPWRHKNGSRGWAPGSTGHNFSLLLPWVSQGRQGLLAPVPAGAPPPPASLAALTRHSPRRPAPSVPQRVLKKSAKTPNLQLHPNKTADPNCRDPNLRTNFLAQVGPDPSSPSLGRTVLSSGISSRVQLLNPIPKRLWLAAARPLPASGSSQSSGFRKRPKDARPEAGPVPTSRAGTGGSVLPDERGHRSHF